MMRRVILALALLATIVIGCPKRSAPSNGPHPRIVSFSPALTTMLFDMGLGDHVVGVTSQDSLPAGQKRPVVGDAFAANTEAVLAVQPDVLVTQINPRQFEGIRRLDPTVRIEHFTIETLDDVASAMERAGSIAGDADAGRASAAKFRSDLDRTRGKVAGKRRPKVLFITDFQTLGTAGKGTFIDQMIDITGGTNVASKYTGWAMMTAEGVLASVPEVLICQANPGQEETAMSFWRGLKDLPATKSGRLFVVTDRRWTIPTAALASFTADLAAMIHPAGEAGDGKHE